MNMKTNYTGKIDLQSQLHNEMIARLEMAAVIVTAQSKRLCAVRTGRLRASIGYIIRMFQAFVGTVIDYAPHVEFGTVFMRAQSFLRAAIDLKRQQIKKIFQDGIRKVLRSGK